MPQDGSSPVQCEGWWEQRSYGRQSMEELRLSFSQGQIQGSGTDIIGPFTFSGIIAENGAVAMRKQYVGQHVVDYPGSYDGEGVLSGQWNCGHAHGPWMIRLRRLEPGATAEIVELIPGVQSP